MLFVAAALRACTYLFYVQNMSCVRPVFKKSRGCVVDHRSCKRIYEWIEYQFSSLWVAGSRPCEAAFS